MEAIREIGIATIKLGVYSQRHITECLRSTPKSFTFYDTIIQNKKRRG